MTDAAESTVVATWWNDTQLDLSYLGDDYLQRLAPLADTPQDFYQKYVEPKLVTQLRDDVQAALATTEEYAEDFANRVCDYFEMHWMQEGAADEAAEGQDPEAGAAEGVPDEPNYDDGDKDEDEAEADAPVGEPEAGEAPTSHSAPSHVDVCKCFCSSFCCIFF
jgi:hypothetical protein